MCCFASSCAAAGDELLRLCHKCFCACNLVDVNISHCTLYHQGNSHRHGNTAPTMGARGRKVSVLRSKCGVLARCMYSGLVVGLPFVARANGDSAWRLSTVKGLCIVVVPTSWQRLQAVRCRQYED